MATNADELSRWGAEQGLSDVILSKLRQAGINQPRSLNALDEGSILALELCPEDEMSLTTAVQKRRNVDKGAKESEGSIVVEYII